jgi:NitT/TauT family transport system substrate-binding protein
MRPASLIALSLLLAPTACHRQPADTSGLIPVTLQADWYPQPEHGGFYDALVKGYYRAEGLDVKILPGGPFANPEGQIAQGSIAFGMQSSDHILEAIANSGEPIVAVGATMQRDPQGIMVHADSPVHTWADLEGHTVAVRPGATWWEYIVDHFHLTHVREIPLTYSVASFVRNPDYIQQCFLTSEPYFADRAGAPARVLLNSDAGYSPYRVWYTSRGYLQAHPDIVRKFTRASIRGWQDYMKDPTEANAMIEKLNPAMSRDWMQYSYNALKSGNFITGNDPSGSPTPSQTGRFDPPRWATMYQQLLDLHVLSHPIDYKQAFTTAFNQ